MRLALGRIVFIITDILDRRDIAAPVLQQAGQDVAVRLVPIAGHLEAIVAVSVKQTIGQTVAGADKFHGPIEGIPKLLFILPRKHTGRVFYHYRCIVVCINLFEYMKRCQ